MGDYDHLTDAQVEEISKGYCADFLDFTKNQLGVEMDFSRASLGQVEGIADHLHKTMPLDVDPKMVNGFGTMLGSYIGEVFLRLADGRWGQAPLPGGHFPGIIFSGGGSCFPWAKGYHRLTKGSEDNLAVYALVVLDQMVNASIKRLYIIKTKTGTAGPFSAARLTEMRAAGKIPAGLVVKNLETEKLISVDELLSRP